MIVRRRRRPSFLLLAFILLIVWVARRDRTPEAPGEPVGDGRLSRAERRLDARLTPGAVVPLREGLAAAIVIDTSGSMNEKIVTGAGEEAKLVTARRAATNLAEQFASYAREHQDEPVLLGLYEFSRLENRPDARAIVPLGPPDVGAARDALIKLRADGGTPIGEAMITAKLALDATGLARRHLLVITDGENTDGFEPHDVTAAIGRRPESERPSMYLVAFEVDARRFERVRDAGALVLGAANPKELNETLDGLLRGRILVE